MIDFPANGSPFLALASGAFSIFALRTAWRRKGFGNHLMVAGGWAMLLLATFLWCRIFGTEFGISYSLAWFATCAVFAVLFNREYSEPLVSTSSCAKTDNSGTGRKWLRFIAAGPVALVSCVPLTLLFTLLLPLERVSQMALASVLFPVLWALGAYWSSARDNPGRVILLFIAAGLASKVCLILLDIAP